MKQHSLGLILVALFANCLSAQIQPGQAAYAALNYPSASMKGGVVVFDSLRGGGYTRVSNLPTALASSKTTGGPNAILVREADGSLLVGEAGGTRTIGIYHLTLVGTRVVGSKYHSLGYSSSLGQVVQMAFAGPHRVAFGSVIGGAPGVGILDLGRATISWQKVSGWPSGLSFNAFTLDRSRTTAYLGFFGSKAAVYSVPLTGGTMKQVGPNLSSGPYQLECDQSNVLHASTFTAGIFALRAGKWTAVQKISQTNAMTFNPVNDQLVFASSPVSSNSSMYRTTAKGLRVLGSMPKDMACGIDIRNSMIRSGKASGGAAPYRFAVEPNPGAAPKAGNASFSLTVNSQAKAVASILGVSAALSKTGVNLGAATVNLTGPILAFPMQAVSGGYELKAPIPNISSLLRTTLHVQSLHEDSSGLASSEAVSITIQ